jgi:hypothetical protein
MDAQTPLRTALALIGAGLLLGSTVLYRVIERFEDWQERTGIANGNPLFALARRQRRWIRENRRRELCGRLIAAIVGGIILVIAFFVVGHAQ